MLNCFPSDTIPHTVYLFLDHLVYALLKSITKTITPEPLAKTTKHGNCHKVPFPFCCVLGKDTLRQFPLLDNLGEQLEISVVFLLNFKRTAIFWHLRKQVGKNAYPMYERFRRFPASQENKRRDKINTKFFKFPSRKACFLLRITGLN